MGKPTYKKKIVILVLLIMTIVAGLVCFRVFDKQKFEGTFKDYDDTIIQEQEEGKIETLVSEQEESIEDNKQKDIKDSTDSIDYKDVWDLSYYVSFLDDDKIVIQRSIYKYGSMPSCPTPKTKIVDGYEYTFISWSPSIHTVNGTQIYIATYTKRYVGGRSTPVNTNATVKYKDSDGSTKSIKLPAGTTITIEPGSGSITGSSPITLTKSQVLDLTSGDYTPTPIAGYAFKGYTYDNATKIFTAEYGVAVTFNMQGHGTAPDQLILDIGDKATKPSDPICDGYVFKGWYKEASCTNEWDFDSDTVSTNTTIYAKWQVTVDFNMQGHGTSTAPSTLTLDIDDTVTEPTAPTDSDYVFKGWYKEASCTNAWNFTTDQVTKNTTLYAKWQVEVTFNVDGDGSATAPNTLTVNIGSKATKPADPIDTNDNFVFGGWYKEAECINLWDFDNDKVNKNTTLYIKWKVKVTFDLQGKGDNLSFVLLKGDEAPRLTDPIDPNGNFVFGGWYQEAACTNEWDFDNDKVNKNTTLYAKWQAKVVFDVQGKCAAPTQQIIDVNGKATKPTPDPTCDNYVFEDWYKESTFENKWDFATDTVTKNTTIYAKWQAKVTFDLNGKGTSSTPDPLLVDINTTATEPTAPTDTDYVFEAWYKEAACTNKWDFDNDKVNKNITLYAKWQAKVTFDLNGKGTSSAPNPLMIDINTRATKPASNPTDSNYVFEAWYKEAACTNKWDFDNDKVNKNITLYAKWQVKVTFDVQGKGTAPAEQILDINATATKPSLPVVGGYAVEGWYEEATFENEWDFDTPVPTNKTLYAKWDEPGYTVTFDYRGKGDNLTLGVLHDRTVEKPSDPEYDGLIFKGWYKEAACTNEWNFDTDTITENTTIYAKWQVEVSFDVQGKGTTPATQTLNIGDKATQPVVALVGNWAVEGWYEEASCTTLWNFNTSVSTSKTLYAKWVDGGVTVTFDVQGKGDNLSSGIPSDSRVPKPANPIDPNGKFVFGGWYTDTTYTTPWDFNTTISTDETIYAKWQAAVTFNMQGHGVTLDQQVLDINSKVNEPTSPACDGYVFDGWYKEAACTNAWDFATDIVTENTTLYAKWTVTVSFNMQGHGTAIDSQTIIDGSKVSKPTDPTATGYEFGGWYKEAACTNAWDFDNDTVTENTILYAKWTVTVSFNMQGHGTAIDSQTIIDGSKVSKPTDPTATGYEFGGWYKEATCETEWNFDTDTVTENTTLYAKWTVTVSFNMQGHGTAIDSQAIIEGSKVSKPTDPTDSDYVFKGWYKEASCTNEWDFDSDTVSTNTTIYAKWQVTVTFDVQGKCAAPAMLTLNINDKVPQPDPLPLVGTEALIGWYREAACTNEWNFASDEVTKNTVLYAKWQTPGVTVTFDLQGKGSNTSFGLLSGSKVPQPIDPTATGYVFDGWYKEAACTNAWDFTTDTASTNPTTLYAKWTVTVTFNMQGHGTAPAPLTKIDINSKVTRPSPDPTTAGYVFKGWYKEAECTNEWDFDSDTVSTNTTIYAKWITALTDKILNAKTIYTDGESACLSDSANSVVNVNGINCYVLKVDGDKAELITQGIYDVRFNSTNTGDESEYKYSTSELKTWLDNFYTNNLKSGHDSEAGDENAILETTVNYYYKNEYSNDLTTYTLGEVNQYVFALDAIEAQANSSKFSWNSKFIDNESSNALAFWTTAGCKRKISGQPDSSNAFYIDWFSNFTDIGVGTVFRGARPAFWISLD